MENNVRRILDKRLNLSKYLTVEEIEKFYSIIDDYLKNRSLLGTVFYNIDLLKSYLEEEGLTEKEIIYAIMNNPSYIHADKADLSLCFAIISVIQDSKTGKYMKDDIIVNHGKLLRCNSSILYARVKHIMHLIESNDPILRNSYITIRKVLKVTHSEFENTYKMSKDELLSAYPFVQGTLSEINAWNKKYMEMKERKQNEEKQREERTK